MIAAIILLALALILLIPVALGFRASVRDGLRDDPNGDLELGLKITAVVLALAGLGLLFWNS